MRPLSPYSISQIAARQSEIADPLASQLVQQFVERWEQGDCPPVERFLAEHPGAGDDPELAVRLIYEELCLRREAGSQVVSQELCERFPQWRTELELLLDCDRLLAPPAASDFPEVGEELGPFRLLAELGRGAVGRVYLAVQPALSDRPVVVKLTPQSGQEHLSLARLQHTGIAPLYLTQNYPERNLRLLCMPYLGGVTLAQLLDALANRPRKQCSGRDIARVIEAAEDNALDASLHSPALQFLHRASFAQAVCWIGACLADALHYAHQRGLCHFDLKPSNVLLARDGQPMLLDFHLARGPLKPGEQDLWLGGTPGYLSPEQQAAMLALREGRAIAAPVDHRSDIYSLGVLLQELLGDARGVPRLPGILQKCLAPLPSDRFPDAAALARELRRGIAEAPTDRAAPARGATGVSRAPTSVLAIAALLVLVLLGATGWLALRLRQTQSTLAETQYKLRLHAQNEQAQRVAANLHQVVEQMRWFAEQQPYQELALWRVESAGRAVWNRRDQFLATAAAHTQVSASIREDLLDAVLLRAHFLASQPATKQGEDWQTPASLLDAAERELGPHPLLTYEKQRLLTRQTSEESFSPPLPTVASAWEHYALARSLRHDGRLKEAYATLHRGIERTPNHFWLQFLLGDCAERLGRREEALAAFSAASALRPAAPESRRRRTALSYAMGHDELAHLNEPPIGPEVVASP